MTPPDFDTVAAQELPGLLRFAAVLTGDRDRAGDVVQEVMVRAYTRWDRISRTDRPGAYLRRMVANEVVSWRRRWIHRQVISVEDDILDVIGADAGDPAAVAADRRSDRDDVWLRLHALTVRQRVALVLRYYEELDYDEIASVLGCRPATVRSLCARGLAALRVSYDDDPIDEDEATMSGRIR